MTYTLLIFICESIVTIIVKAFKKYSVRSGSGASLFESATLVHSPIVRAWISALFSVFETIEANFTYLTVVQKLSF